MSAHVFGLFSLISSGLMAGLFYAYSISVMWGLDRTEPNFAIGSFNGINIAILNAWFLPVFVGLPVLAASAGVLFLMSGQSFAAWAFFAAAVIYFIGTFCVTVAINVPMNDELARFGTHPALDDAGDVWREFSTRWTLWNHVRTGAAILAFVLSGFGLVLGKSA